MLHDIPEISVCQFRLVFGGRLQHHPFPQLDVLLQNITDLFLKDLTGHILVATARGRDLTLVTADERILAYDSVATLNARK